MKTYKTKDGNEFTNVFAYALDLEHNKDKFALLFAFINSNYPDAIEEWRCKHNFLNCTYGHIETTLLSIEVLQY